MLHRQSGWPTDFETWIGMKPGYLALYSHKYKAEISVNYFCINIKPRRVFRVFVLFTNKELCRGGSGSFVSAILVMRSVQSSFEYSIWIYTWVSKDPGSLKNYYFIPRILSQRDILFVRYHFFIAAEVYYHIIHHHILSTYNLLSYHSPYHRPSARMRGLDLQQCTGQN